MRIIHSYDYKVKFYFPETSNNLSELAWYLYRSFRPGFFKEIIELLNTANISSPVFTSFKNELHLKYLQNLRNDCVDMFWRIIFFTSFQTKLLLNDFSYFSKIIELVMFHVCHKVIWDFKIHLNLEKKVS